MARRQEWVCSSNGEPECLMSYEYRYKPQIRKSNKVIMKVNTTQAITRVQPLDTKTQKPSGKNGDVFPNQMQVQ